MVGDAGSGTRPGVWEPWEARRRRAPRGIEVSVREARADARLLIQVVRARLREGAFPLEHIAQLAAVARDQRIQVRRRRVAATLLYLVRLVGPGSVDQSGA